MKPWVIVVLILVLLGAGAAVVGLGTLYFLGWSPRLRPWTQTYETEHTDYHPPEQQPDDVLADDKFDGKQPAFDPARVDRRPLGPEGEWLVNSSAAVLRLDVPLVKPDTEAYLLTLHPSYAAAVKAAPSAVVLPSVNLLDGKAKQFDDGLYAALDQAYYQGLEGTLHGHVQLVRRIYDKLGKDSPAAPFLAAGLELAGVKVEVADRSTKDRLLGEFRANEVQSKPIGFYTWSEKLAECFRFLRFFQQPFNDGRLAVPLAIAKALAGDKALLADYQKAMAFYARLTNPYTCLTVADLADRPGLDAAAFRQLCKERQVKPAVALFPPSTSKETVLFEKLFPGGLPPDADLMRELVRAIRSGKVDLKPGPNSGWYEYQVYALETLLLPEKGQEHERLLLTKAYKNRMLEAFQALVTKRRETHVRQLGPMDAAAGPLPPDKVKPRLRVEPCPSYYLRTARAYAFLANFLEAALGPDALKGLHGLKHGGQRQLDLHAELQHMRDLFYGLYLVSAEDIGLKPELAPDEGVDEARCSQLASDWLPKALADPDLAADTRVAVPVYVDAGRGVTRLWATLGVRLAKLHVEYVRPPHLKPAKAPGDWQPVEQHRLEAAEYLIPVDEFAEIELKGLKAVTREELRCVCDREQTKEAILEALK